MRRKHSAAFKAKVALAAMKEQETMGALSSKFGVHRVQIQSWKKQAIDSLDQAFVSQKSSEAVKKDKLIDDLYKKVGQLEMVIDLLKKTP